MSFQVDQVYVVKKVLTGTSFVIRGKPVGGPPPTLQVQLLFLKPAPSTTQFTKQAWSEREYLRELLVGRSVKIAYIRGHLAAVWIQPTPQSTVDLGLYLLQNGMATIQEPSAAIMKELPEYLTDSLLSQYKSAISPSLTKLNIHSDSVINLSNPILDKKMVQSAFQEMKNKKISVLVESVLDSSTFIGLVEHYNTVMYFSLAGLNSPMTKDSLLFAKASEEITSVALEGQFFVESKILQKRIELQILGLSSPALVAKLTGNDIKNFELSLLNEGFVSTVPWGLDLLKPLSLDKSYLDAESHAKEKQVRLWKKLLSKEASIIHEKGTQQKVSTEPGKTLTATPVLEKMEGRIVKILSGDSVQFQPDKTDEAFRVFLSGIKQAPLIASGSAGSASVHTEVGFRHLAKEELRTKSIGKRATLFLYQKGLKEEPVENHNNEKTAPSNVNKTMGFVILPNHENLSDVLIAKGLATVSVFAGLDKSSKEFSRLLDLERDAKEQQQGMHAADATSNPPMLRVIDVQDKGRAESLLPSLQRHPTLDVIIEHVFQVHRFKIFIPSLSYRITVTLPNVIAPAADTPLAFQAKQFIEDNLLQRQVQLSELSSPDKFGIFYGQLKKSKSEFVVAQLLTKGFVRLRHSEANLSPFEDVAKKQKLGIWKDLQEIPVVEERVAVAEHHSTWKPCSCHITHASALDMVHVQLDVENTDYLALMQLVQEAIPRITGSSVKPPPIATFVCQSMLDQKFYRARIQNDANVYFIDIGRLESVTSKTRYYPYQLFSEFGNDLPRRLTDLPPQAMQATFETPLINFFPEYTDSDVALSLLSKYISSNAQLEAIIWSSVDRSGKIPVIVLDVAVDLLQSGMVFIPKKFYSKTNSLEDPQFKDAIPSHAWVSFLAALHDAKRSRLNGWTIGTADLDPDDRDDEPMPSSNQTKVKKGPWKR